MNRIDGKKKRKIRTTEQIKKNNKSVRPILFVSRSNKNIYAQIVDSNANVLLSMSSLSECLKSDILDKSGIDIAFVVGSMLAKKALDMNIREVVFNKGAYAYSGRVKALADGARKSGYFFNGGFCKCLIIIMKI